MSYFLRSQITFLSYLESIIHQIYSSQKCGFPEYTRDEAKRNQGCTLKKFDVNLYKEYYHLYTSCDRIKIYYYIGGSKNDISRKIV